MCEHKKCVSIVVFVAIIMCYVVTAILYCILFSFLFSFLKWNPVLTDIKKMCL